MKDVLAITAQSESLDADMDLRFGRSAGFLIYDRKTNDTKYLTNEQQLTAVQGAGIQAARKIVNNKVEAVITGNIGPKAFRFLSAAEVDVYLAEAVSVQEAILLYEKGELAMLDRANVDGHW